MKVCDVFAAGEFEDLISEAESNAVSGWDMSFVEDLDGKFKQTDCTGQGTRSKT